MAKATYDQWLKEEFSKQIDSLDLKEEQKTYLRYRWLDQVLWMSKKARQARDWHYGLSVVIILAGVTLPVLVTTAFGGTLGTVVKTIAIVLGLVVAGLTAIKDFFNFGERWRHYRNTVELLKAEWWHFYSRNGSYADKTHAQDFVYFCDRIEEMFNLDVKTYITEVVKENKQKQDRAS